MAINLAAAIYQVIYDAGQAFAKKGDVPTRLSQLTNDTNYQTEAIESISINGTTKSAVNKTIALAITDFDSQYQHIDKTDVDTLKTDVAALKAVGAQANVVEGATIGESAVTITNKILQLPAYPTVPTNVSAFTNDAGYQNGTQVQTAISSAISTAIASSVQYRGTVANRAALPANPHNGDMYNLADTGMNVVWNETDSQWDDQAPTIDTSVFALKTQLNDYVLTSALTTTLANYVLKSELADLTAADIDAKFVEYGLLTA